MNALLGEPRVVDDPRFYGSVLLDHRKNMSAHLSQHRFIGPLGLRDEMVERLMRSLDTTGLDTRGNRFDALAFARKDQAGAIGTKRRDTIRMPQDRRHRLNERGEPTFTPCIQAIAIHGSLRIERECLKYPILYLMTQ